MGGRRGALGTALTCERCVPRVTFDEYKKVRRPQGSCQSLHPDQPLHPDHPLITRVADHALQAQQAVHEGAGGQGYGCRRQAGDGRHVNEGCLERGAVLGVIEDREGLDGLALRDVWPVLCTVHCRPGTRLRAVQEIWSRAGLKISHPQLEPRKPHRRTPLTPDARMSQRGWPGARLQN